MPAWEGRRVRAAVLAVVLLVGVAIVADATAAAGAAARKVESIRPEAPVELLLSTDGVTFVPSLSGQVLHRVGALVPGEAVEAPLWVRNPTDARVRWRVEVRELSVSSPTYAESVALSTWYTGAHRAHTTTLDDLSSCDELASPPSLAPGGTAKILLTFGMDLDADNGTQGQAATLRISITMRDSAGGPLAPPACEDGAVTTTSDAGRPSPLADTGSALSTAAIAVGALFTGIGLALVLLRRRFLLRTVHRNGIEGDR